MDTEKFCRTASAGDAEVRLPQCREYIGAFTLPPFFFRDYDVPGEYNIGLRPRQRGSLADFLQRSGIFRQIVMRQIQYQLPAMRYDDGAFHGVLKLRTFPGQSYCCARSISRAGTVAAAT